MASLEEYFKNRDKDKPEPKWVYGDRISGKYDGTTVVGMVIREDYNDPSLVLCHLDLPVRDGRIVIYVPSRGMKRLKNLEDL